MNVGMDAGMDAGMERVVDPGEKEGGNPRTKKRGSCKKKERKGKKGGAQSRAGGRMLSFILSFFLDAPCMHSSIPPFLHSSPPSPRSNPIAPLMTPIPRAYLPPFVWDLVYFDRHSLSSYAAVTVGTSFLASSGLLVLDALQPSSVLPEVVLHGQVTDTPDPRDLDPFKHACVEVLTSLQTLIGQEGSLARLYSEQLSWMSESSQKSCEIWFDLFMVGSYDQAWLVGSTVLEQLLGTVSHACQLGDIWRTPWTEFAI